MSLSRLLGGVRLANLLSNMFQTRDEGKGVWRSNVQDSAGLNGGQFFAGLGTPDIFDKRSRAAVQPRVAGRGFFIGL